MKLRNSYAWNNTKKAENGLDYSVTLAKKAKECAKLDTVALFLYPDCLSKVEIAFSRGEEELCVDASQQPILTLEPKTVSVH